MSSRLRAELVVEGRIATLAGDAGFGWQAALAIGQGRVLGAGSLSELEGFIGPRTERWHLVRDEIVMPSITDAHLHLMLLVLAEQQVDLSDVPDLKAALRALREAHLTRERQGDSTGWLLGHGWSLDRLGRWPDADMLERACPARPVALYAHDHHSRWVSRAALRLAGIDDGIADPPGGIIRRDASRRPTGVLHEAASSLLDRAIPDPDETELKAALVRQAAGLAKLGVTGCHDPGELGSEASLERGPLFYRRLASTGRLPLRVHASVRAPQLRETIELGLRSGQGVA
ncbi:MAG: amidohydrolase family protein, partial [Chloroflexota bacterium]|nr:amidohydrolase family protein [Chloroflexota bacterium]